MKRLLSFAASVLFVASALAADPTAAVTALIPRLADADVGSRYAAQMELQDLASQSSKPGNAAEREALGKVLAAKAADAAVPQPARVWIVRQLEYMGGAEAVATLTKLMSGDDAELREVARRALEKNPAPAATDSLRAELAKATDARWKTGLINALGWRGDTASVSLIAKQLGDAEVGTVAALSLGRIGDAASLQALWSVFGKNAAAGDGLLIAANALLAKGNAAGAKAIAEKLYAQAAYPSLKAAALSALAKADPASMSKLLTEALTGSEIRVQQSALTVGASLMGKDFTPALVALLPKLTSSAKVQVLNAVDASAEPQVIAAVDDTEEPIRRAALEALGRMGGAASVPVLIKAVLDDAKPGKSVAEAALARISGDPAAAALVQATGEGDSKSRVVAISAISARKHLPAIPALFKYTADADSAVRKASFSALKNMGSDAEIEPLAKLVLAGKAEAGPALDASCQHSLDKPAAVKTLLALAGGDEPKLASLMEPLAVLGGDEALGVLTKLSTSANAEVQNDAVRALGNWPDFAAAKPLMAIANNKDAQLNQYILAVQGVVRLVKSVDTETPDKRVALAGEAMTAARRPEEKKLVLSAYASIPNRRAAAALKPFLNEPDLKKEACAAAASLAEALVKTDKKNAHDLATALKAATTDAGLIKRADKVLSK